MMESYEVSRELGRLTEAVNGLRRDMQEFKAQRADLSKRTGALERFMHWAKGAIWITGGVAGFLGLDRITKMFH